MSTQSADKPLTLILGVHNHQPYGNFDFVFRQSVDRCYRPLTRAMLDHPQVSWVVHYSGPLLLWLKENDPELLQDIRTLVKRGQVEMLASGIAEPILYTLPPRDVVTQVAAMQDLLAELFGVRARGIWLTERIWEPGLPSLLHPLGIQYVLTDDYHFYYAGMEHEPLNGYFSVEKYGQVMKVFPISEALRYRIPFKPVPEFMAELTQWAQKARTERKPLVLTYVDDGEKFGVWPDTYEWVYEKGWLKDFMEGLAARQDLVETTTLGAVADRMPATGRFALPTASYREMMHWSLPPRAGRVQEELEHELGDERSFSRMRGGFFDMFLVKYEESNRLHKRMLYLSQRLHRLEEEHGDDADAQAILRQARFHLHMSQSNDVLWHGLFGGLYLPFLRGVSFEQVIRGENLLAKLEEPCYLERRDFSCCGGEDLVLRTREQTLVLKPADGGTVYLWDDHVFAHSYSDCLTRRQETYHYKVKQAAQADQAEAPASIHDRVLAKEADLDRYLIYDRHLRASGRLLLTDGPCDAEALRTNRFTSPGDLGGLTFVVAEAKTVPGAGHLVKMHAQAADLGGGSADITKTVSAPLDGAGFDLRVAFSDVRPPANDTAWLWLELNLTLNADDQFRRISVSGEEPLGMRFQKTMEAVDQVLLEDDYRHLALDIGLSVSGRLAVYPIETVSVSEGGFERNYQGTCLSFGLPLAVVLARGAITLSITRLRDDGAATP